MGRRMNGEGSLRKRKDGRYEARIMVGRWPNGRPHVISFYGNRKGEAREKLEQFLRDQACGVDLASRKMTFSEWADIWYENKTEIAESTRDGYGYTKQLLMRASFTQKHLKDIRPIEIEWFLKELRKQNYSKSTITKCKAMLSQIFSKAVAQKLLLSNPVEYVEKLRFPAEEKKEVYSAEEMNCIIQNLPEDRMGCSIRIMCGTGIRSGECRGLERRHIAEDGEYILVEQAAVRQKGGKVGIGPPKTESGVRRVPIPPKLRKYAVLLRNTDKKYIWESEKVLGQPVSDSCFRKQYEKAISNIGMRVLHPHALRHSYATQMEAMGVSLETVAYLLGHSKVDHTRHYINVQLEQSEKAQDLFGERVLK